MREDEQQARTFAKNLRSRLTNAETILWSQLKSARAAGYHFRRQHPIGPFIADFACIRARLVIEVDGATHGSDEEHAHDVRRDQFMRERGWRVLRVRNHEVYEDLDAVLESIWRLVPPPSASARLREPRRPPPP
jgi:very-short-patch-repair endonuclease